MEPKQVEHSAAWKCYEYKIEHCKTDGTWELVECGTGTGEGRLSAIQRTHPGMIFRIIVRELS